jgi:tetratricopeptide (TPR) repeat protein
MSRWSRSALTLPAALLAGLLATGTLAADARDSVQALYQASYDLESSYNYAGALGSVEALLEGGQDDYVVHLRHGWLLYLNGKYADAVLAYQEAVKRQPGAAEPYAGLALPLMALRRWKEAETACRKVVELAPGNYTGMSRLAYVFYSAGRYAEAADQYARVVALYPSDVEMRAGLGWSQLKLGKTDAARASFTEVLRTAPAHVSAREGLEAL